MDYDVSDEVDRHILVKFADLNVFVKAYDAMNNDAYNNNETYAKLMELL